MINRRRFIVSTVLGSAAIAAGCGTEEPETDGSQNAVAVSPFQLDEFTVSGLGEQLASGQMTSVSITELYLNRIAELDTSGPELRSMIETNPEALVIADALDQERGTTGPRGPLHGIPIVLKDNIDTADQMTTAAGSLALEGSTPLRDSFLAQQLRAAGAVILGKANLSEWANFRSRDSSSGWSGRGGQCRNPYVLDHNPCGSSSGSAVAVSANLAPLAIGTETNGSIVCPASRNGIVGIKPTVGLVSRSGIIPISATQDTAGPMTRTVTDAALVLGALTGVDPRDPATNSSDGPSETDYAQFLDPGSLGGARIGVARNFDFDEAVMEVFESQIQVIRDAGAQIVDPADIPNLDRYADTRFEVMLYEFKDGLSSYLDSLGPDAPVGSLAEIIEFNSANASREMPYFGQDILIEAEAKGPLTEQAYIDALRNNLRFSQSEGIDQVMDENTLDAIIAPTGGPAWVTDHVSGDSGTGSSSTPAAVAGYPSVTVPMGFLGELPVNISFIGRAWTEPLLLGLAFAYEQATGHRRAPRFLTSLV